MKLKIIHISLQVIGAVFLAFGVLGLFLPFLQGILFIVIGLVLFSVGSERVKLWVERKLVRFPRIREMFNRHHGRITDQIRKRI
jgi:uncharacterized membrane protein YbaN (DUF454 family)